MRGGEDLGELMLAEEARLIAKARLEIAAEEAAWAALSDDERAAAIAARAARWDALVALDSDAEDVDDEDQEDEE